MSHLTDLQCSMYADNAIPEGKLAELESHLAGCEQCRQRVDGFVQERSFISNALEFDDIAAPVPPMTKFYRPMGLREFAIANVETGVVFWLAQFLWKTIFGELIINGLTRLSAIYVPDVYGTFVNATLYFSERGTTMFYSYLGYALLLITAIGLTLFLANYARHRAAVSMFALTVISASLLMPSTAEALERRYSEDTVTVTESETIDDTLIASGDTVVIEGSVKGDLIAFARKVIVNGDVSGNLMAFGESVSISGDVQGFVMTAGSTVLVNESKIGGDFWSAAGNITVGKGTSIARNATLATEFASITGDVGRDAHLFGESFDIQGTIGEDVVVYADRVNLLSDAHVVGDLSFHTNNEEKLQRSPSSKVDGKVEFLERQDRYKSENKYLSADFYLHQLFWIVSAFVFGFALLHLIPTLRELTLYGDIEGVKTAGIGLVAIVSMPVLAALVAVTFIGIPLAVLGFAAWILILYISKIVLANLVGQMIFKDSAKEESLVLTLLVGLLVVLVGSVIPVIGGVISFLMVIVGSGLIVQQLLDYVADLSADRAS